MQESFADILRGGEDPNRISTEKTKPHVQESFADILKGGEDPNSIPAAVAADKPKPARKRAASKPAPAIECPVEPVVAPEPAVEPAPKKARSSSSRKPNNPKVPSGNPGESTEVQPKEAALDDLSEAKPKAKKRSDTGCWNKHGEHQQAKTARREKAKIGVELIRKSGVPALACKVPEDFDRVNLTCN